jgi:hypothetical protein
LDSGSARRELWFCVLTSGPLDVRPMGSVAWAPVKRPVRLRATCHRPHGIEHLLAFYDVDGDYLNGIFRNRGGHPA